MGAPRLRPHDPAEYARLLEWVSGAGSLLEIGSRYGYTLVDLAQRMSGKRVVSVDYPDQEGWNDQEAIVHLRMNISYLKARGFDAHLFEGDSKDIWIKGAVKDLGPFDVIFIDGDHTYEGVLADWQNYGGELGTTYIFHDIRRPEPPEWMGLGVWRLWNELKTFAHVKKVSRVEEFLAPGSKMGIGKILIESME